MPFEPPVSLNVRTPTTENGTRRRISCSDGLKAGSEVLVELAERAWTRCLILQASPWFVVVNPLEGPPFQSEPQVRCVVIDGDISGDNRPIRLSAVGLTAGAPVLVAFASGLWTRSEIVKVDLWRVHVRRL